MRPASSGSRPRLHSRGRPSHDRTEASAQVPQKVEPHGLAGAIGVLGAEAIGVEADVYCTGWLADEPEAYPATIVSAELVDSKDSFIEGTSSTSTPAPRRASRRARSFWIVRPTRTVYRWESVTDRIGQVSETPGAVRSLRPGDVGHRRDRPLVLRHADRGPRPSLRADPDPARERTPPLSSCDRRRGRSPARS